VRQRTLPGARSNRQELATSITVTALGLTTFRCPSRPRFLDSTTLAKEPLISNRAARRPARHAPPLEADGNRIHNEILLALPRAETEIVSSQLELVRLKRHQVLHEVGDSLKSAYFCNTGMVSILTVFPDGKSVEVGLIGKEGFVGLPLIAGFRTSATRATVQTEATAFRLDARSLPALLVQCPKLREKLRQFSQVMMVEVTQIAACNRLHEVEQRLSRWLLMSADRVGSKSLPLTQDLLSQMLGTRRSSVTIAAGALQKAGLIAYTRGNLNIVDRQALEKSACDCYRVMRGQIQRWLRERP
jgi:CRP-like cAMP-binding protein